MDEVFKKMLDDQSIIERARIVRMMRNEVVFTHSVERSLKGLSRTELELYSTYDVCIVALEMMGLSTAAIEGTAAIDWYTSRISAIAREFGSLNSEKLQVRCAKLYDDLRAKTDLMARNEGGDGNKDDVFLLPDDK